jgi:hypothetical protein
MGTVNRKSDKIICCIPAQPGSGFSGYACIGNRIAVDEFYQAGAAYCKVIDGAYRSPGLLFSLKQGRQQCADHRYGYRRSGYTAQTQSQLH